MAPPLTLRPSLFAVRSIGDVAADGLMAADNTRQDLPVVGAFNPLHQQGIGQD